MHTVPLGYNPHCPQEEHEGVQHGWLGSDIQRGAAAKAPTQQKCVCVERAHSQQNGWETVAFLSSRCLCHLTALSTILGTPCAFPQSNAEYLLRVPGLGDKEGAR